MLNPGFLTISSNNFLEFSIQFTTAACNENVKFRVWTVWMQVNEALNKEGSEVI